MESIMTNDLEHCYICGSPNVQIHHIFAGSRRKKSDEWKLIVPLCMTHHTGMFGVHNDPEKMNRMKQAGQRRFEELYGHDKFMQEFGKNFL